MSLKPMLAATCEDVNFIRFPVLASPKLDGIRCLIKDGVALSRSLKPIPNKYVQSYVRGLSMRLEGLDGELIVGPHDKDVFRRTTSGVMSEEGKPDFTFYVFDLWNEPQTYFDERLQQVTRIVDHAFQAGVNRLKVVPHRKIVNPQTLEIEEERVLAEGYEGLMLRDPDGPYKYGRATAKQGWLLKLKQFVDAEAVVVGVEERMHNENEATKDALGHTERSTSKAGLVPAGDLGALVCKTPEGQEFNIGTGFTAEDRIGYWRIKDDLIGRLVKYKYFPTGAKDKPRFPVFLGWRHEADVGG